MLIFSNFERSLLRKLISLEKDNLLKPNRFFNGLLNIQSQVEFIGRPAEYQLQEGESHYHKIEIKGHNTYINTDYFEIKNKLIEANDLLNFLILEGYILRYEGGNYPALIINIREDFTDNTTDIETIEVTLNTPLKELLEKCSFYYQVKEPLRDLVNNRFKSKEERNNLATLKISGILAVITFISLVINVITCNRNSKEKIQELKIDTTSINYIINKL